MLAVLPQEQIEELQERFGFSAEELAQGTGSGASTIYARKARNAPRRSHVDPGIDAIYYLCQHIVDLGADEKTARGWLVSRSMHLDGAVPLDTLRLDAQTRARAHFDFKEFLEGRLEELKSAAKAYSEGTPASEYRRERNAQDGTVVSMSPTSELRRASSG